MKLVSTMVVSVLVAAGTYVAMHLWIGPRLPVAFIDAPAFVGMTVAQARALAEPRGLRLVLDEERPDDKVAPGTICDQRPLAGSMLRRGDEVHAAVARRGETTHVPRTAGMTPAAARELVERALLRVGESVTVADAQTPAGLIVGSVPAADAEVKKQTVVQLRISSGAAMAAVPQLFGKRLSSAKELLEKAGFQLGAIKHGSSDDRDPGEVIGQTPKATESAPTGSKIDLVVAE